MKTVKKILKNNKGASAVEFALVTPVLLTLVFGIVEYGIIMIQNSILEGAAAGVARKYKALAREGNAGAGTEVVTQYILNRGAGLIKGGPNNLRVYHNVVSWGNASGAEKDCKPNCTTGTEGQVIQYNIYYVHDLMLPFLKGFFGKDGKITLNASTVVQNEPTLNGE